MRGSSTRYLFSEHDGSQVFRNQIDVAKQEVESLTEERVLNTDIEQLVAYFVEKFGVEVPELDFENATATEHERNIEVHDRWDDRWVSVKGMAIDFEIPFSGEADVFKMRPDTWDTNPPNATIKGQSVCFSVAARELSEEQVTQSFERIKASLIQYLGWHETLWKGLPGQLAAAARGQIEHRRERLLKQKKVASSLSTIGVKLKEKPGDAKTFTPPAVKQKISPKLPPMKKARNPEPTLDAAQYTTIIGLLSGSIESIEQSSRRMRELDEESLRDILLVPLNSHFESAKGEAFNFSGKTDILIQHEGSNLFVAECKFWKGEKQLLEAIDQLLGYLTWRDTKTALIVFNRNRDFSQVRKQLETAPQKHPNYASGPTSIHEAANQFKFTLPKDEEREILVSIIGADLGST